MILGIGGNRAFDFDGFTDMDLRPDYLLAGPAEVHGKCIRAGEDTYDISGVIELRLTALCAKCAEPAAAELRVPFAERFVKEPAKEDTADFQEDETYPYTGEEIDLGKALSDNVFLNLPGRILCSPHCKGLCPICGANLNKAGCGCMPHHHNPFAVLRQLELPEEE